MRFSGRRWGFGRRWKIVVFRLAEDDEHGVDATDAGFLWVIDTRVVVAALL